MRCSETPHSEKIKRKLKVMVSLCLTEHYTINIYRGEWRYNPTHSLIPALDGGLWSVSRPGRLTSRDRALDTHWIGRWASPRAGLNAVAKRKIPILRRDI